MGLDGAYRNRAVRIKSTPLPQRGRRGGHHARHDLRDFARWEPERADLHVQDHVAGEVAVDGEGELDGAASRGDGARAVAVRPHLNQDAAAQRIEAAVQKVLTLGLRTGDIWSEGTTKVGTAQMGDAVVKALR